MSHNTLEIMISNLKNTLKSLLVKVGIDDSGEPIQTTPVARQPVLAQESEQPIQQKESPPEIVEVPARQLSPEEILSLESLDEALKVLEVMKHSPHWGMFLQRAHLLRGRNHSVWDDGETLPFEVTVFTDNWLSAALNTCSTHEQQRALGEYTNIMLSRQDFVVSASICTAWDNEATTSQRAVFAANCCVTTSVRISFYRKAARLLEAEIQTSGISVEEIVELPNHVRDFASETLVLQLASHIESAKTFDVVYTITHLLFNDQYFNDKGEGVDALALKLLALTESEEQLEKAIPLLEKSRASLDISHYGARVKRFELCNEFGRLVKIDDWTVSGRVGQETVFKKWATLVAAHFASSVPKTLDGVRDFVTSLTIPEAIGDGKINKLAICQVIDPMIQSWIELAEEPSDLTPIVDRRYGTQTWYRLETTEEKAVQKLYELVRKKKGTTPSDS